MKIDALAFEKFKTMLMSNKKEKLTVFYVLELLSFVFWNILLVNFIDISSRVLNCFFVYFWIVFSFNIVFSCEL